jgi:hypothetical protein
VVRLTPGTGVRPRLDIVRLLPEDMDWPNFDGQAELVDIWNHERHWKLRTVRSAELQRETCQS